jgi:hypothetical protein
MEVASVETSAQTLDITTVMATYENAIAWTEVVTDGPFIFE